MEIKSIKILGRDGCRNCTNMFQKAKEINTELNLNATCEHVTAFPQIMALGVMSLPGLVINEKVVSYGKILSKEDILAFVKTAMGEGQKEDYFVKKANQ